MREATEALRIECSVLLLLFTHVPLATQMDFHSFSLFFKGRLFRQNLLKGVLNLDFCAVKINGRVSVIDTNEFALVLCNGFQHFAVPSFGSHRKESEERFHGNLP